MKFVLRLALLTLLLIVLTSVSNAAGDGYPLPKDDPRIRSSVGYLLSCQNPDGGFGDKTGNASDLLLTAEVAMALVRTGDINLAVKDGKTPLDYLVEKRPPASGTGAGDLGRYVMGVVAAGGNPHDLDGADYVDLLKYRARQAPGLDPFAEAYVLLGLIAAGDVGSQEAQAHVRHLKNRQLASGGWGQNTLSPDTNTTGLAICALVGAGEDANSTGIEKAATWLESVQNDDGGFSTGPSSPTGSRSRSGELAIMAILAAGKSPITDPWCRGETDPVVFLLSCQQPDGAIWSAPETPGPVISGYTAFGAISLTGGWLPTAVLAPPQALAIDVNKTANVSSAAAGDVILYSIRVNNTGNVRLTGIRAYDNLTRHEELIGVLEPGKNASFTMTYTVKEDDLGNSIVNNVTANGTANGIVYREFDTATVYAIYSPGLDVNKTANVTEVSKTGDVILYTVWVNNTGDAVLGGVVADDDLTKHKENIGSLAPGKNITFTTTYTVKGSDLGKPVVNNVTANGTANGIVYKGLDTATVNTVYNPNIEVNKTANVTEVNKTGDEILYTVWVNNTGDTVLSGVVADDSLTKHKENIGSLDPGQNHTFTTTYTVKEADLGTSIVNNVTARGTGPGGEPHENFSTATVKTIAPETVTMQLMVFNDGVLVYNTSVDVVGVEPTSWDAIKQSGVSYEYTDFGGGLGIFIDRMAGVGEPMWGPSFWHNGKLSDWGCSNWKISEGEIDQWIGPNSPTYSAVILRVDGDTPTAVGKGEPFKVKITEETVYWGIDPGTPSEGATVTGGFDKYTTNADGLTDEISLDKDACYCVYAEKPKHLATYWLGAISPMQGVSTVKCGAGGPMVCDLSGQKPPDNPNIEVNKTADRAFADVGNVITYTVWVNNTGDTVLNEVVARDDLTDDEEDLGVMEPGQNETFTIVYTVTGNDLGEPIVNRVTAEGDDPDGNPHTNFSTATVETPRLPVEVRKTARPKGGISLTDVTFTIAVTDTGDKDLQNILVVDRLPPGLTYISDNRSGTVLGNNITWDIGPLNAGKSVSIELKARIDGTVFGNLTNAVNVTGTTPASDEVTHSDTENVTAIETDSLDFGDAPDCYPTLQARNGARHIDVGFHLGPYIDNESDAWSSPDAMGDNKHDLDDENGVNFVGDLVPGEQAVVEVTASDDGGYLNAWIDFDADGDWTGDQILANEPLKKNRNSLTFSVPATAKQGSTTFARFRFSTKKDLSFTGLAPDGEVEDYMVTIQETRGIAVTKTVDKSEIERGDEVNYTIWVNNTGADTMTGIVVEDVFDRPVEIISASPMPDDGGLWHFDEILPGEGRKITLRVKVPDRQTLDFEMDQGVEGTGFVNVANDYVTTAEGYVITNHVYVTFISMGVVGEISASASVTVKGDLGTELSCREHGSGDYESDDLVRVTTKNRSVSMEKDVSATYRPTTLGLYRNRTVDYSSRWTEEACARNRVTGASMHESYKHVTEIDRNSRMRVDKNGTTMELETEFEGMGHIGILKKSNPDAPVRSTPAFELLEDYTGSFRIYEKADESKSSVSSERSTSGTGYVAADRRIGEIQRSYEVGTGTYSSEEKIDTSANYIAKDINVTYQPTSFKVSDGTQSNATMMWKEEMWSKNRGISFIGEAYTGINRLDKETVAEGLNEMKTEAEFSGRARYRVIMKEGEWKMPYSTSGPIYIGDISVDDDDEWIEIANRGTSTTNMTNWSLSDEGGFVYTFPQFILDPDVNVTVFTGHGTDTATKLYMDRDAPLWNDDGDVATLKDANGNVVDILDTRSSTKSSHEIDLDDEYIGNFSIRRNILMKGIAKYDKPHMAINKSGEFHYQQDGTLARYTITVENDGNRALGPVYVEDIFPSGGRFINASTRPSELTSTSANWTLTHLAIGGQSVIELWLDVTEYAGDELVNRVEASGGYNETWVTATNFTALEIDWLTCCLARTVSVTKTAKVDPGCPGTVRYNLTIENLANSTRVAQVTDHLPEGMVLLTSSIPPSSFEDGKITWNLIDIEPFETRNILYKTRATMSGTFVNRVYVDARSIDGPAVPTVYASSVVTIGESGRKRLGAGWVPPNWDLNLTCEEACDMMD